MVFIVDRDLILSHQKNLLQLAREARKTGVPVHINGFVNFILSSSNSTDELAIQSEETPNLIYAGYPEIARLGFIELHTNCSLEFIASGLDRLINRSLERQKELFQDSIAVLGVALLIQKLNKTQILDTHRYIDWFNERFQEPTHSPIETKRIRDLGGEIVNPRGLLNVKIDEHKQQSALIDFALRAIFPYQFRNSPAYNQSQLSTAIKYLLVELDINSSSIELAALYYVALNSYIDQSITRLLPTKSDLVRILEDTQHSFKRWVWQENANAAGKQPARWLIDNEYHVQSFLWCILYPIFKGHLVDEVYVESFGNKQPRIDIGVLSLKTIIEVKFARNNKDYKKIEEEIAGDLGIYFTNLNQYDSLIVYIYDDNDNPKPEKRDSLRNAILNRSELVEDVIFVVRPSMLPTRSNRKTLNQQSP